MYKKVSQNWAAVLHHLAVSLYTPSCQTKHKFKIRLDHVYKQYSHGVTVTDFFFFFFFFFFAEEVINCRYYWQFDSNIWCFPRYFKGI